MRKLKFLCMTLSITLLLSFGLAACSSADTSPMFDEKHPWTYGSTTCTETSSYEFSRYLTDVTVDDASVLAGEDKDKGYKLNSFGALTYTIKEGTSIKLEDGVITEVKGSDTLDLTLIKMELSVDYKDNLAHIANATVSSVHVGKKDTMVSYSVINRYTLAPLFTYKKTDIGAQSAGDNKSYTLTADYTGNFTGAKQAKLTDSRGEFKLQIKDGKYYDSESIYYTVRAMRSVRTTDTTTRTFDIASPYDNLLTKSKKLSPKAAQQVTETSLSAIALSQPVYNIFDIAEDDKSDKFELDCYKTTLSLTDSKSGPPIYLYYAAVPTVESFDLGILYSAKKVLVMSSYKNHDKKTNAVYLQEFKLTGYSKLSN